jgi:hypothetical protein
MGKSVMGELPNGYVELIDALNKFYSSTGRTELSTSELINILVSNGVSEFNAKNIINKANGIIIKNLKFGMYTFDTDIVLNRMYAKAYIRNKLLKVESEISKLVNLDISKAEFELVKTVVDGLHKLM